MARLLRKADVFSKVGLREHVINELEAAGRFPKRIVINPLGGKAVAWSEDEIDAWIAERLAEREAA